MNTKDKGKINVIYANILNNILILIISSYIFYYSSESIFDGKANRMIYFWNLHTYSELMAAINYIKCYSIRAV